MQRINAFLGGLRAPLTKHHHGGAVAVAALFLVALWISGDKAHYCHTYMLVVSALAVLALVLNDRILAPLGLLMAGWHGYLFSGGFSGTIPDDILVQAYDGVTLLMAGGLIYYAIREGRVPVRYAKNVICSLAVIVCLLGVLQFFYGGRDAISTLSNRNFYAAFLAISLPLFFRKGWQWFVPVLCLGLVIAQTSTAIAAAVMATGYLFWGWRGAVLGAVPGAAYYVFVKGYVPFVGVRWDYWADALEKVSRSWDTLLFGVGSGVYWSLGMLHSEYVYLLFNLGIVGLVLALLYIGRTLCYRHGDRALKAAFLAVCIDGIGNHVLHTAPTAMLALVVMALLDEQ